MVRSDILSETLNNPVRFEEIAVSHLRAVGWQRQGYIPLGIIVNDPANTKGIGYDQWLDAKVFFEVQAKILSDTLTVGSDYMPVLPLNHLGDILIPTMFGAEIHVPDEMAASLQDQGPTPLAVMENIQAVDNLTVPDMQAGMMPDFAEIVKLWRQWAPEWIDIVTPFPMGAFSLATALRRSEFLLDLADDKERCQKLLSMCAEIQVEVELYLRELVGPYKNYNLSNFGVCTKGRRMGDDSIILLSPGMISEFAIGHIETVAKQLGPTTLHFCTLADRRSNHVFAPLAESEHIPMVSSQFAFEFYQDNLESLRGQLAIESFYGQAYKYVCDKFGSFGNWAYDFVPRFKNESGLILYFEVPSIEKGKALWDVWQQAHQI